MSAVGTLGQWWVSRMCTDNGIEQKSCKKGLLVALCKTWTVVKLLMSVIMKARESVTVISAVMTLPFGFWWCLLREASQKCVVPLNILNRLLKVHFIYMCWIIIFQSFGSVSILKIYCTSFCNYGQNTVKYTVLTVFSALLFSLNYSYSYKEDLLLFFLSDYILLYY